MKATFVATKGLRLKRYHVIAISLLIGLIAGAAVPAKAQSEHVGENLLTNAQNFGLFMARKTGSECEVSREAAEAMIVSHIIRQVKSDKVTSEYAAAAVEAALMQYDLTCKLNLLKPLKASEK